MPTWSRRRIESALLAVISILSVIPLRTIAEDRLFLVAELLAVATFAGVVDGVYVSATANFGWRSAADPDSVRSRRAILCDTDCI